MVYSGPLAPTHDRYKVIVMEDNVPVYHTVTTDLFVTVSLVISFIKRLPPLSRDSVATRAKF